MGARRCVCGIAIPWHWSLCAACLERHGADRARWPEWVAYLVADIQRELDDDRRHDHLTLYDGEIEADDRYPSERGDGAIDAAWREIASWRTQ